MRISDWSSDVCSSDLGGITEHRGSHGLAHGGIEALPVSGVIGVGESRHAGRYAALDKALLLLVVQGRSGGRGRADSGDGAGREQNLQCRHGSTFPAVNVFCPKVDRKSTRLNSTN